MPNQELAFAKQGLLHTRDWDTFQGVLRRTLRPGMGIGEERERRNKKGRIQAAG